MKKHNYQSGFGHIGILLVVLALLATSAAGYFVYSRNNKKDTTTKTSEVSGNSEETTADKTNTNEVKNSNLKTQETVTTYTYNANDYVGWKEYCSKTEKACFKYPSDWVLTDNNAGKEFNGVGEKITSDMENISISAPSTISYTVGVEWSNFLSGLGGGCGDDEQSRLEVLSYSRVSSRPSDYVVEFTSKSSEGKVFYRLLNYDNQEPRVGVYDLKDACFNTFYKFFKGKNLDRNILFEARGTDQASRGIAKKIVESYRYQ